MTFFTKYDRLQVEKEGIRDCFLACGGWDHSDYPAVGPCRSVSDRTRQDPENLEAVARKMAVKSCSIQL